MNYEMLREIAAARRKSLMFLLFLVILNVALFLYLGSYQRPALEKAQNEWFAKRDALASGQTVSAAARYDNALRDLALFQQRIIPKKDFAAFLSRVYDAARKDQLSLKGTTFKPAAVKDEPLVSYGISFTVSGKYSSIKSFIRELTRMKEMVTLDSITLSSSSPTEELVDLKVDLTAYLKKEGA